eukprot:3756753-Pyramimonas_sp.AAC.1
MSSAWSQRSARMVCQRSFASRLLGTSGKSSLCSQRAASKISRASLSSRTGRPKKSRSTSPLS